MLRGENGDQEGGLGSIGRDVRAGGSGAGTEEWRGEGFCDFRDQSAGSRLAAVRFRMVVVMVVIIFSG